MSIVQLLAASVVLGLGGWLLPEFYITVLNYVGLYGLVALGVMLLTGVSGITSFGQAAFVGLSAYTTTIVSLRFGLSPFIGLVAAVVVVMAAAALIGSVTLRLSGHYLPLATIAWGFSAYLVAGNLEWTGGQTGLTEIPPIRVGSMVLETNRQFYFVIWVVSIVAVIVIGNMLNSRSGRAMRSIKNARETAESFGISIARTRLIVFIYSALLACVSGWLYAHMIRFVNPSPFSLTIGIEYLFMAVVGGAGHVLGAFFGAAFITVSREVLQGVLPRLLGQTGSFEVIVFGALIIILLQINRDEGLGYIFQRIRWKRGKQSIKPTVGASLLPRAARMGERKEGLLVQVAGITKRFDGLVALQNVSFEVGRREIVSVIGPNGAGKSTLFNVLTGILLPDDGTIAVREQLITGLTPQRAVALGMARTFQHVQLVPELTVIENVMLGAHIRGKAGSMRSALRLANSEEAGMRSEAQHQLARLGLSHLEDVKATSLALGQQRLLEIARALCADPDILLLDEPAAGLRHKEKQELAKLLRTLRADGITILLVEHDMSFVMNLSDRVIVINFGQKLVEGPPAAIRSDPRVIEAYLGTSAA